MYLSIMFSVIFAAIIGGYAWLHNDYYSKSEEALAEKRANRVEDLRKIALRAYSSDYFPFHMLDYKAYRENAFDGRFDGKVFIGNGKYCSVKEESGKKIFEDCGEVDDLDTTNGSDAWKKLRFDIFSPSVLDSGSGSYRYFIEVEAVETVNEWNGAEIPYAVMNVGLARRIGRGRYVPVYVLPVPTRKAVEEKIEAVGEEIFRFAEADMEKARVAYSKTGNPFVFEWGVTRMECVADDGTSSIRYFYQKGSAGYAPATAGMVGIPNTAFLDSSYIPTPLEDSPTIEGDKVYGFDFTPYPDSLYGETNVSVLASEGVYGKILYKIVSDYVPTDGERFQWIGSATVDTEYNALVASVYGDIWRDAVYGGDKNAGYGYFCAGTTPCAIKKEIVSSTSTTGGAVSDVKLLRKTMDEYWKETHGSDSSSIYNPLLSGIPQRGILLYDNSSVGVYGKPPCDISVLKGKYSELYAVPYPVDAKGKRGEYEDPALSPYPYKGLLVYKFGISSVE